ncbi:MAG: prepilin-type N-terminal cleavage/methylation domain-containing protein [Bacillota bacterium]|nr:prepilin-type N-terminal cleavage/methylation domain-containing protein [Bacillota bacterium]
MSGWGRFRRDQGGFTLFEMVLATVLAGLLLAAVLQFWQTGVKGWLRVERQADTAEGVQMALDRMGREVREARQVLEPAPGDPPSNRLRFISGRDGTTVITYYTDALHSGWLYRRSGSYPGKPVAEKVKEFRVASYADGGVPGTPRRVTITLVGEAPGFPDLVFQTSVRLQVDSP